MSSQKIHFRVSGKITKLLGRESVSQSITALFEILKNSHDADALTVAVEFRNILSGDGKIIIREEDGDGMTYDDIVNKFFVIGTYSKEPEGGRVQITKRLHRKTLGNKGVGRFALERLGGRVKIISRPINTDDKFIFEIDWGRFEPKEVTIDQIDVDIQSEKRDKHEKSGLEIEISDLRDLWNEYTVKDLELKIQRLILPKELQPSHAFNIILDAPEFGFNDKTIVVELLKRAYYYLKADLFDDRIKILAKVKDQAVISAAKKNDVIKEFVPYKIGGKITKSEREKDVKHVKDFECGTASLRVYYFPIFQRASKDRRDAEKYYGEVFASLMDADLPKYAGIRIFRDGMREFTYGDPKNDWVDRANISRNLSGTLQADRIVGYTLITHDKNQNIIATTNRQTAIENQAFLDLREFVIQSMLHFDRYLNHERRKTIKAKKDRKRDKEAIMQLVSVRRRFTDPKSRVSRAFIKIRNLTGEDLQPEIDLVLDAIDITKERLKHKIESDEKEMSENQIEKSLASLGNIVSMMIHETNNAVAIASREVSKLKKHYIGSKKLLKAELYQNVYDIFDSVNKIKNWNNFIDRFTSSLTLEDVHSKREQIIVPFEIARDFAKDIKKILAVPHIKIENEINPTLKIKMFSAYFESIIGNLLTNAIKAINTLDDKELRENRITITSERSEHSLVLYVSDNGPGIPKDRWEIIFQPRISYTSKETIFKGHGLGLPIVNSMVREYDGSIRIVDPIHADGTTFQIIIPWKNIDPKG